MTASTDTFAAAREQFLAMVADVRPDLHRYCARLTGSVIEGEDIVQDALAKAFYALSLEPDVPPLRYLRLTHPVDILTCVDCYARAEIHQRLDDDINGRRALVDARAHGENLAQVNPKG